MEKISEGASHKKIQEQEGAEQEKKEGLQSEIKIIHNTKNEIVKILIAENGIGVNLCDFVPKGTKFVNDESFRFDPGIVQSYQFNRARSYGLPTIFFPEEEINSLSGRLGLLHEIGHVRRLAKHFGHFFIPDIAEDVDFVIRFISNSEEFRNLKDQKDKEDYVLSKFQELRKEPHLHRLKSDKDVVEVLRGIAKSERTAWAEAFMLYRKIKHERKIDLFDGAENEEIFRIMEGDLSSYQDKFGLLKGLLTPEQQIKLFLIKKYLR